MELDPYRLNISGLTISSVMIALFFAVLWRSNRRAELRWWTYAWLANVAALMITSAFWYFEPPPSAFSLVFAVYLAATCVYVWLHVRGTFEFLRRWPRPVESRQIVPVIAGICVVAVFVITTRDRLGLVSHVIIAAGCTAGTIPLLRSGTPGSSWLAIAFVARALLSAAEAAAYGVNLTGSSEAMFAVPANAILAAHYPLDIGVQWLLAMGMVIAIDARAQRDLDAANSQMVEAQAGLRRLVDRDPLTGLANRGALPEVFRAVQPEGALLIFFDLNDFKKINDEHGHQAGDECLVRFATALGQCFRPSDAVIRYGGDEFLVVATGISETSAYERTDAVRSRVGAGSGGALRIRFSVGMSRLAAGGNPEQALHEADDAMYRAKRRRPARARAASEVAQQLPLG